MLLPSLLVLAIIFAIVVARVVMQALPEQSPTPEALAPARQTIERVQRDRGPHYAGQADLDFS